MMDAGALLLLALGINFPASVTAETPLKQVLAPRQLFPFQAYKDVQIFHYTVAEQVEVAKWEFQANGTPQCGPVHVSVYLQHGSYPVVQVEGGAEPAALAASRQPERRLGLRADLVSRALRVKSPLPGDWFAVAFYTFPKQRQEKQGSPAQCQVWLSSTATFHVDTQVVQLVVGYPLAQRIDRTHRYRFYASPNSWWARVELQECGGPCPLRVVAEPRVLPITNSSRSTDCVPRSVAPDCVIEATVAEDDWNYLRIEPLVPEPVTFRILVHTTICPAEESHQSLNDGSMQPTAALGITLETSKHPQDSVSELLTDENTSDSNENEASRFCFPKLLLVRQKLPGNFAFQYSRPVQGSLGSLEFSPLLNVTTRGPSLAAFRVMPLVDVGGTFAVELALPPSLNTSVTNVSISACLYYNQIPQLTSHGTCRTGYGIYVNSSAPSGCRGKLLVPFPEAGPWYLLLQPRCYLEKRENFKIKIVDVPCHLNTTSLILRLESGPCILGQCGDYGRCYQYLSGGLVFSSCLCTAGRKGWGCTDDSGALTYGQLLVALLLLTLSNVLFLPVIILSIYRRFFTEALVYLAAMTFSALYHACDFEVSPFCVMRLSVLQYCDVYSSVLALWLTLVALGDLPSSGRSLCHMTGALGIALGVEYDRTGLWVFLVPIGAGICLTAISWVFHCYYQHSCYPRKRIWLQLLFGFSLLGTSLVLFTLLESRHNYVYVHSGRHGCLALAILCLLPDRRSSKGRQEAINTCSYIRVEELSDISHPIECGVYQHLLPPSP